jgi:aspartyl-tRNA(Asn)/glutamyl-tRNA(Gln) amidotransferase subunit C
LRDDEVDSFASELNAIMSYVEQIDSVDVSGLEPTDQVTGLTNVMRPDEIADYSETTEQLLQNAPEQEKNQIKVKRVL